MKNHKLIIKLLIALVITPLFTSSKIAALTESENTGEEKTEINSTSEQIEIVPKKAEAEENELNEKVQEEIILETEVSLTIKEKIR